MKTYTRAQSYLWVFDRSLICLLLGYIFDTWQLWGELDKMTIFYEDLSRKTIKKQIYWKGHLTACRDIVDEILLSGASATRSSGQTDGHRKTAYDIESKFKKPTILKNKSELLQSQFLRVKSRQRESRNNRTVPEGRNGCHSFTHKIVKLISVVGCEAITCNVERIMV